MVVREKNKNVLLLKSKLVSLLFVQPEAVNETLSLTSQLVS